MKYHKKLIKIAKYIHSVGLYMSCINKYLQQVKSILVDYIHEGKLNSNLIIKLKINKNQIKNIYEKDSNFLFIQIYSPNLYKKEFQKIGINCTNNFSLTNQIIQKPQIDNMYSDYNTIHIGLDYQEFEQDFQYHLDVIQHEMIHVFEMVFGYKNKKFDYDKIIKQKQYENSWQYLTNLKEQLTTDYLSWETEGYYGDDVEINPYTTNFISNCKKIIAKGADKKEVIDNIAKTNWDDIQSIQDLIFYFEDDYNVNNESPIYMLYHVRKKNQNKFKSIIKRILTKLNTI